MKTNTFLLKYTVLVMAITRAAAFSSRADHTSRAVLPSAMLDLRTAEGASHSGAQWRFSDTQIQSVRRRDVGSDLKPTGPQNPTVLTGLSLKNLAWAFKTAYFGNWHPLTWFSHMLDVEMFGLNAGYHHLTNLFIHICNACLLFLLLGQATRKSWPSAAVAALFAVHPLHVESVAWISERKDVLSTF